MSHLLKAAKLSADMIQRRDDMRHLLGSKYAAHCAEARAIISAIAKRDGVGTTEAALSVAKAMDKAGHDPSMVIAALVDECEGSV